MIWSIVVKEWIKMRKFALWALVLSVAFECYLFVQLYAVYRLRGAVFLWEMAISRDVVFVELYDMVPLAMGCLLALSQFVPEMQSQRLKLTLHLPFPQRGMLGWMLAVGVGVLGAIYLVDFLLVLAVAGRVFAAEIVGRVAVTMLTWYLAGFMAYVFTAWLCLEVRWRRRLSGFFVATGCIYILYLSNEPGAYVFMLFPLLLCIGLFLLLPFGAVQHYKNGERDY